MYSMFTCVLVVYLWYFVNMSSNTLMKYVRPAF